MPRACDPARRAAALVPAVAVAGEGEELHDGVLVVVELLVRRLADDDGLDALALDLVREAEGEVDLRLDGGHEGAVGDGCVGTNNHFEIIMISVFHSSLSRGRGGECWEGLTEVVGHVGDGAGEVRLGAGYRPPLAQVHAVPALDLEGGDVGRVVAGRGDYHVDGVQLAVLGLHALGCDLRDR